VSGGDVTVTVSGGVRIVSGGSGTRTVSTRGGGALGGACSLRIGMCCCDGCCASAFAATHATKTTTLMSDATIQPRAATR
jgi:hypothetical protein